MPLAGPPHAHALRNHSAVRAPGGTCACPVLSRFPCGGPGQDDEQGAELPRHCRGLPGAPLYGRSPGSALPSRPSRPDTELSPASTGSSLRERETRCLAACRPPRRAFPGRHDAPGPMRAAPCAHRQSFPARSTAEGSARAASLVSPPAGVPSLPLLLVRLSSETIAQHLSSSAPLAPATPGPSPLAGVPRARGELGVGAERSGPALAPPAAGGLQRWPGGPQGGPSRCVGSKPWPHLESGCRQAKRGQRRGPAPPGSASLRGDGGELSSGRTPAPPALGLGASGALCHPRSPVCGDWSRGRSRPRTRLPLSPPKARRRANAAASEPAVTRTA